MTAFLYFFWTGFSGPAPAAPESGWLLDNRPAGWLLDNRPAGWIQDPR